MGIPTYHLALEQTQIESTAAEQHRWLVLDGDLANEAFGHHGR